MYRESLKLAYRCEDEGMKESMLEMMKDEFRPFRLARSQGRLLTQEAVDYNLAKIRQRINECEILLNLSM